MALQHVAESFNHSRLRRETVFDQSSQHFADAWDESARNIGMTAEVHRA
jgi:hypothetical protein